MDSKKARKQGTIRINPGTPHIPNHTYFIGNLRLALDVEVRPGKQHAAAHTRPGLWQFLKRLPPSAWPTFLRGDCAFGTDHLMREAEAHGLPYLFKLKQTKRVKGLIEKLFAEPVWERAGQGWDGVDTTLQLQGWAQARRVVVLRRRVKGSLLLRELLSNLVSELLITRRPDQAWFPRCHQ